MDLQGLSKKLLDDQLIGQLESKILSPDSSNSFLNHGVLGNSDSVSEAIVRSPIGALKLRARELSLLSVEFLIGDLHEIPSSATITNACLRMAIQQLEEYFAGVRTQFEVAMHPHGTDFQLSAWRVLHNIPYGHVISYQEQAKRMEHPRAVRAVGGANRKNPLPIFVPCHRVVGKGGSLVGFSGGLDRKKFLLEHERKNSNSSGSFRERIEFVRRR